MTGRRAKDTFHSRCPVTSPQVHNMGVLLHFFLDIKIQYRIIPPYMISLFFLYNTKRSKISQESFRTLETT